MISWGLLSDAKGGVQNEISSRLAEINNPSIFMHLPFEHVEEAFRNMDRHEVKAGEIIIREGDRAGSFFLIEKGSVEVLQEGLYDSEQRRVTELGVGDHFCEDALNP
jgi:CRP-like cAMP-binding protein